MLPLSLFLRLRSKVDGTHRDTIVGHYISFYGQINEPNGYFP